MLRSESDNNYSYTTDIAKRISNQNLCVSEDAWITFLQDHRYLLRENSNIIYLTEAIMNRHQYCIRSFLKEQTDEGTANLEQAFRIANKLHSEMEFTIELGYVYVPTVSYVTELRNAYTTLQTQLNKLS